MFGRALIRKLLNRDDIQIRAMVRDRSKFDLTGNNLEVVVGDMDDPPSLIEPTHDISHVFLTSPMDEHITRREEAVVDAARTQGTPHVLNIYGAVRHKGDHLDSMPKVHLFGTIKELKKNYAFMLTYSGNELPNWNEMEEKLKNISLKLKEQL